LSERIEQAFSDLETEVERRLSLGWGPSIGEACADFRCL